MTEFPSATTHIEDRREVLLGYLDYFRAVVRSKLEGMDAAAVRTSRLPSGWTPIELLSHLVSVERRWVVWGFEGRDVGDPWADTRDDRWYVPPDQSVDDLLAALDRGGTHTREVVLHHALSDVGAPSERWDGSPPAQLERVLLHLLQEFARHAGHLDIVRELADGRTGEDG